MISKFQTQHAGMFLLFLVSHAGMHSHPDLFNLSVTYHPFHKHTLFAVIFPSALLNPK